MRGDGFRILYWNFFWSAFSAYAAALFNDSAAFRESRLQELSRVPPKGTEGNTAQRPACHLPASRLPAARTAPFCHLALGLLRARSDCGCAPAGVLKVERSLGQGLQRRRAVTSCCTRHRERVNKTGAWTTSTLLKLSSSGMGAAAFPAVVALAFPAVVAPAFPAVVAPAFPAVVAPPAFPDGVVGTAAFPAVALGAAAFAEVLDDTSTEVDLKAGCAGSAMTTWQHSATRST